ncbi:cytochrome b [Labrys monachus]|uniref:Cytochrome b561 n=1 Tax=Labrys monachus TaxID=217067 RepID=A0ABU0FK62_9HYPH|nr:cytochrome b/b6 domain-containing protein [Labrys monachus]MDQ0394440.1 cytochrome b561 [Labrys monachus]
MSGPDHYGTVAVILHWAIALLIVIAFGLGLTIDAFPESWTGAVVNVHVLVGLSVLVLSIVRLAWRLTHRPPPLPDTVGALSRGAAAVIHVLLYVLMILIPAIGIPTLLFRGRGIDFGLFQTGSPFARTPEIFRPLTEVHELASYALIALAAGHALAALYHQFADRDGVLRRMLPPAHR